MIQPNELLEQVKQFVNREIRPYAADFEMNEKLPRGLIDKMARAGYLAASFPAKIWWT